MRAPATKVTVTVPESRFGDGLDRSPNTRVVVWDMLSPAPCDATLVVTPYVESDKAMQNLSRAHGVRVVQTMSAGVDVVQGYVPAGAVLCNAAGVHDAAVAELAVGLALTSLRGIHAFVREDLSALSWPPLPFQKSLADRRVLLLGPGRIGNALAKRLLTFDVVLTRVGRTRRIDAMGEVRGLLDLPDLLHDQEVVFLTLPLTAETQRIVNQEFLARLPDGALLVNVGRGGLIDSTALLAELRRGRLSAALDVYQTEPIPRGHELLSLPNVLMTPHIGAASTAFYPRMQRLLLEQVARLNSGIEPTNIVSCAN